MPVLEAAPFLRAVLADPDDDAPRLIYADWLDENGDGQRAEFIRIQCQLARLPAHDGRRVALAWRERALFDANAHVWRAELPQLEGVAWGNFERGFVADARVADLRVLLRQASALPEAAPVTRVTLDSPWIDVPLAKVAPLPWLRGLKVGTGAGQMQHLQRLAESPLLSTLRSLDLGGHGLQNHGLAMLAASPHLENLSALNLEMNYVGAHGIPALASARTLKNLTTLSLHGEGYGSYSEDPSLGRAGARQLAECANLARLTCLDLGGSRIDGEGLRALLQSRHLRNLRVLKLAGNEINSRDLDRAAEACPRLPLTELDLSQNAIGDRGFIALATLASSQDIACLVANECEITSTGPRRVADSRFLRTALAGLRVLSLNSNTLGPDGVEALAALELPHLHTLRLAGNDLGSEGGRVLAGWEGLRRLTTLDVASNHLDAAGVEALAGSAYAAGLLELTLDRNRLDDAAQGALARSKHLGGLRSLSLGHNLFGQGLTALARAPWLGRLQALALPACDMTAVSLEALSGARCPALTRLLLGHNKFGDAGVRALARSPLLRQLAELSLPSNRVENAGAAALAGAGPLDRLRVLDLGWNRIREDGMAALAASANWPNLTHLNLSGNGPAGREVRESLQKRYGRQVC
jgi:uncharacterized protein (TIGR02996 family)